MKVLGHVLVQFGRQNNPSYHTAAAALTWRNSENLTTEASTKRWLAQIDLEAIDDTAGNHEKRITC